MSNELNTNEPKHQGKLRALDSLSLGISMVVAVALGVGIGLLLKDWTGKTWTLWIGVLLGILAAFNNVYKAYKRAQKEYEGMENDPRYAHRAKYGDQSNDDDN
ncbi:MAG: AtpZ/AtpI family protein [Sulfurimonadaceae bacterium]|jgi:F0F1-type ATP synthase assembly protein I|nr:AtpZ/AtpI family protein [Arcobacteraceae bacterium]MDX9795647.1 AtpZ/AtpI family protein [Arcobacteraceae bacterium]